MRAAKWKLEDGKKRLKSTMEWRREFKPELIEPGDVGVEAESGKMWVVSALCFGRQGLTGSILTGFDTDARPILYLRYVPWELTGDFPADISGPVVKIPSPVQGRLGIWSTTCKSINKQAWLS
jgi:hypothetical protein